MGWNDYEEQPEPATREQLRMIMVHCRIQKLDDRTRVVMYEKAITGSKEQAAELIGRLIAYPIVGKR